MHHVIRTLRDRVPNIDKAVISVHCHNDLGMAVANSLAAVEAGAGQIECTINGLGERAGNCSLEEVVMALRTRHDYYHAHTNVNTRRLVPTSRNLTGISVVCKDFNVHSVTVGKDAQGEVMVQVEHDGRMYRGRGISTDSVEASARAFLNAVNKIAAAAGA